MLPNAMWSMQPRCSVIHLRRAGVACRMRLFAITALLFALPAAANDFSARYPAGSIRDEAAAQRALKEADHEMARIAQSFKEREAECYRRFLVNSCRDDVRREKELAEREVKRIQLEANDFRRKLDAERVAKRRTEQAEAQAAEDAERQRKSAASRAEIEAREAQIKQRDAGAGGSDRKAAASNARTRQPQVDRLTAAERAENLRQYEEKQKLAAKRAQEAEDRRKENEQRRAENRKQAAQREAEREAIRKKAAEALKEQQ